MSNRFHNKWHRKNHHTYGNLSNPDASHDPIASSDQPFLGEFVLQGALCAVAPMSAFAGYFYSNFTALCAFAGYRAIQAKAFSFPGGDSIGLQVDSQNIAISAYAPAIGLNVYSMTNAISAYGKGRGAFIGSDIKGTEIQGGSIGAEIYSTNKAISANGFLMGAEIYSNRRAISAYGSAIGAEIYSPNVGISAYSPRIAIRAIAPNKNQNYTGIRALDVTGYSFFDGDVEITGSLSANGYISRFDTYVVVTSSTYIENKGTDTALTVIQRGNVPVAHFYDDGNSALFIDGTPTAPGYVGINTATPNERLTVVGNISGYSDHVSFGNSRASGTWSFSEGTSQATGNISHAEGRNTIASGDYSHSEGSDSWAASDYSHAEGDTTKTGEKVNFDTFYTDGTYSIITFNSSVTSKFNNVFAGTKLIGYLDPPSFLTAFTVINRSTETGTITGDSNFSYTVPTGFTGEGYVVTKTGIYGHAEGKETSVYGIASHAEGIGSIASGTGSHAEGDLTVASGSYSHAEGDGTIASGNSAHAEGILTSAIGYASHSQGGNTQALQSFTHAEGQYTVANGIYGHAEGVSTIALSAAHAEGSGTQATGQGSHAEGHFTIASAAVSHAAGVRATASQNYSYIWSGDNTLGTNVQTTLPRQYLINAPSGVYIPRGIVGIGAGTDYPNINYPLTVNGRISSKGIDLWNSSVLKFGYFPAFDDGAEMFFQADTSDYGRLIIQTIDNADSTIVLRQRDQIGPNNYNRLVVGSDGNIGIGTGTLTSIETFNTNLAIYGTLSSYSAYVGDKLYFGSSTTPDVNLYRSSENTLKTDDNLITATISATNFISTNGITPLSISIPFNFRGELGTIWPSNLTVPYGYRFILTGTGPSALFETVVGSTPTGNYPQIQLIRTATAGVGIMSPTYFGDAVVNINVGEYTTRDFGSPTAIRKSAQAGDIVRAEITVGSTITGYTSLSGKLIFTGVLVPTNI